MAGSAAYNPSITTPADEPLISAAVYHLLNKMSTHLAQLHHTALDAGSRLSVLHHERFELTPVTPNTVPETPGTAHFWISRMVDVTTTFDEYLAKCSNRKLRRCLHKFQQAMATHYNSMGQILRLDEQKAWKIVQDLMVFGDELGLVMEDLETLPWHEIVFMIRTHLRTTNGDAAILLEAARADHFAKMTNHAKFVSYINKKWRIFETYGLDGISFWSRDSLVLTEHDETPLGVSVKYISSRMPAESFEGFWLNCSIE
jgi:hypothetical protein